MKTQLTCYRGCLVDANGNVMSNVDGPAIDETNGGQLLTAAGSFAALPDETKYVRVSTDTAIHFKDGAGAATTDPMIQANSTVRFAIGEGAVPSIILA